MLAAEVRDSWIGKNNRSRHTGQRLFFTTFVFLIPPSTSTTTAHTGGHGRLGSGDDAIKSFNPQPWHVEMGATEDEAAEFSVAMLEEQILYEGPHSIAAIMVESICGSGGVLIHPKR